MERDLTTGAVTGLSAAPHEAQSAVSWAAIFAGAATALATAFVLLALAAGFGLKLASPWPDLRAPAEDFTPIAGAVLAVVQVLSAAFGGYLAGRLRTKWVNVHDHEVHFRDTAHGLLVWALSTVAGVALAAAVMVPAAAHAPTPAGVIATVDLATAQAQAARAANLAAQASLFMGIGLLLSAFTASVAAGLGGLRRDEMHATFWSDPARARGPAAP
jgi:hypothetical protein